jgi:hypothetical protein
MVVVADNPAEAVEKRLFRGFAPSVIYQLGRKLCTTANNVIDR